MMAKSDFFKVKKRNSIAFLFPVKDNIERVVWLISFYHALKVSCDVLANQSRYEKPIRIFLKKDLYRI
ncbi:hypothetical protein HZS_3353 [Henneguya salminicola]|nr:hypothetical protein HZS_3353 [Henneguya salminicola]